MKRLILTIAAVASVAGPMAVMATGAAAQDRGYDRRDDRRDDRYDRRDDRRDDRYDRRDDRRDDRYDRRGDRRDDRRWNQRTRWERGSHNGYYYNNRWYYGPPPQAYYGRPGYRPGYTAWRRGATLPAYYRGNSYRVNEYRRYGLRPPPRGYYWYNDNGNYLLAAIATGVILDVIINNDRY